MGYFLIYKIREFILKKLNFSNFHVGRHNDELSNEQQNEINNIAGDLMKSFGYYE